MGIHDGHREKMRQRYLKSGLDSFADHEALELLLYYAIPRRDTNPIAHALMDRYGTLSAVLSAPVEDLQKVEKIGETSALLISLVAAVSRKARLEEAETVLSTTKRIGAYLLECFDGEKNEVAYQLCLDRKGKLISRKRLGEGSVSSAFMDVRRLVENVILTGASGVVLAHNHPSGVALPSQEDYTATDQIRMALETINVPLLDHIIVADGDYVSMRESGYL